MTTNKKDQYDDFPNVESTRNDLAPESLPEGAYGSPRGENKRVQNKETPWKEGQKYISAFTYENKEMHENTMRLMPGAHPPKEDLDEK
jgi:hypothetical protein